MFYCSSISTIVCNLGVDCLLFQFLVYCCHCGKSNMRLSVPYSHENVLMSMYKVTPKISLTTMKSMYSMHVYVICTCLKTQHYNLYCIVVRNTCCYWLNIYLTSFLHYITEYILVLLQTVVLYLLRMINKLNKLFIIHIENVF